MIVSFSKTVVTQVFDWHRQISSLSWMQPLTLSKGTAVAIALLMVASVIANVGVRSWQLSEWQNTNAVTQDNQATLFSTADAPYFLRHSAALHRNETLESFTNIQSFPNRLINRSQAQPAYQITDWPLISIIIDQFAQSDDPQRLVQVGNQMILATSALTCLMIILCFGAAGYWLEGCVAGLGGGLSAAYLVRSSIGRIDTDQLNLGFMYLLFGLTILAGRARSWQHSLLWCVLTGLFANLFMWWYGKPELIVIIAIALSWILLCLQRKTLLIIAGPAITILLSGVTLFDPTKSTYLQDVIALENFSFPNALETITEVRRVPIQDIFVNATGSVEMGLVCLSGLFLFLLRHPVVAVTYGPLVVFALLNFVIGNRAVFYSAPILWFGFAFAFTSVTRFVAENALTDRTASANQGRPVATTFAAGLALVVSWVNSPTSYVPKPTFPAPVLEGLASLKETTLTNAVVATWWDYGFASAFFNNLPTLHDGGTQTTPTTHFVARSFVKQDQPDTLNLLRFLASKGERGISLHHSNRSLEKAFRSHQPKPEAPDLYFVLTNQMAGWIGSISKIANWDIEAGKPLDLPGLEPGEQLQYYPMNCRLNGFPQTLACQGVTFDLERGLMNGQPGLVGWTHSQDGQVVRQRSFDNGGYFAVQLVQTGPRLTAYLVHRQLYESTFNELFYFRQIDDPSLTLHYDDYPHIRIYKISGDGS